MSLELKIRHAITLLNEIENKHAPAVFANSLGAEDMVLTDLISKHAPSIGIFSLDTGRLPQETYDLMKQIPKYYGTRVQVYFPDRHALETFVTEHGVNAFYDSAELRRRCCQLRKVEPLQRALQGKQAWITGLRREQAPTRQSLNAAEWDAGNGLHKFNPLIEWTQIDVWSYIREFNVPYNMLHDRSYPSIGCAPCTRAVAAGQDIRAGRWWWEDPESKECGLHKRKEVA
jgi:phosphoadenosine phosphosulfate reductase